MYILCMQTQNVFRPLKGLYYIVGILSPVFFVAVFAGMGFDELETLLGTFIGIALLVTYFFLSYRVVTIQKNTLLVKSRSSELKVTLDEICSMSFGSNFLNLNQYSLRLRDGTVLSVPLVEHYDAFEKLLTESAGLVLEEESLENYFEFRILTPKARRWTKKGRPYQTTGAADRLNPFYVKTGGLAWLFFGSFILAMAALSIIARSN